MCRVHVCESLLVLHVYHGCSLCAHPPHSQHEFGHGLAAWGEGVTVMGFGVLVAGGVLPGAFVRLCPSVDHRPLRNQLRVYFAGVWHNLVGVIYPWAWVLSLLVWKGVA